MRYVRGTPAADRLIARRWGAALIRGATMGDLLSEVGRGRRLLRQLI
jgi:hypothetical protein